jgi:hypothetical protein
MILADVLFASLICREIGCPLQGRSWPAIGVWSLSRIFFWMICWLPGPVKWREKSWQRAREPS